MTKVLSTALFGAALALAACSSGDATPSAETGATRSVSQAIIHGTASVKDQDFVVQIAIEQDGQMIPFCTGSLIAKNLVITARHCTGVISEDETSITDFAPANLKIYTGTNAGPKTVNKAPEAQGAKLFTDPKKDLVPDIAVIMLDKQLSAPVATIRLEGGAVKGEALDVIGYGLTEKDQYPQARQQRKGLKIIRTGPATSNLFELFAGEFQFGEAACAGDSGGPAVSAETGAIVGIASRVTNGQDRDPNAAAAFCLGSAAEDVYSDLTRAKTFIEAAFEEAGATPSLEAKASPEENAEAETASAEAPTAGQNDKAAAEKDGCSIARTRSSASAAFVALLVAVALTARRGRRAAPR